MPTLPAYPDLDQLRHQAKDLLRAAQSGDTDSIVRVRAVSDTLTLAAAQLALAREYGFASWPRLKEEVEARTLELAEKADEFCQASINGNIRRAAHMLEETPAIGDYSFATAVVLGMPTASEPSCSVTRRSRRAPTRAPAGPLSTRPVRHAGTSSTPPAPTALPRSPGCSSKPAPTRSGQTPRRPRGGGGLRPLRCVIASLEQRPQQPPGRRAPARPRRRPRRPRPLPRRLRTRPPPTASATPRPPAATWREIAEQALAAPISNRDTESARLLLRAGADPRRYRDDDGRPTPIVWAALQAGCERDFLELLLAHQAIPNAPGPDERTPYQLATAAGRTEIADLLRRHGAADTATRIDRFLSACRRADRADAEQQLENDPRTARAADRRRARQQSSAPPRHGDAAAVATDARPRLPPRGPRRQRRHRHSTPPPTTAAPQTVRLLLDRGADIEAHDTNWNSTPLDWAAVGSGEQPRTNPTADWLETVRALLEHGASTDEITLDPDDPKQPSTEVAELLRRKLEGERQS